VVGYLRPLKQWNDGKQAEFADRKTVAVEDPTDPVCIGQPEKCAEPHAGQRV
jgi:hypothetical protein